MVGYLIIEIGIEGEVRFILYWVCFDFFGFIMSGFWRVFVLFLESIR